MATRDRTDWLQGTIDEFVEQDPDLERLVEMGVERRQRLRAMVSFRQKGNLSQSALAERMHTSQAAVARLESGSADPKLSTLERYAASLGLALDWQLTQPLESGETNEAPIVISLRVLNSRPQEGGPPAQVVEMRTSAESGRTIVESLLAALAAAAGGTAASTTPPTNLGEPRLSHVRAQVVSEDARNLYEEIFRKLTLEEALATWSLGKQLFEAGDVAGAERAFQRTADSNFPEVHPLAWNGLGVVRYKAGDYEKAQALFAQAMASDLPSVRPRAARNLGLVRAELGDPDGARRLLHQVTKMDDAEQAARAWLNIGDLEASIDREAARHAYQNAAESGIKEVADLAMVNLEELGSASVESAEMVQGSTDPEPLGAWPAEADPAHPVESVILATAGDSSDWPVVLQTLMTSPLYSLGEPAGEVSEGHGTESDLLHYTVETSGGAELTLLPVFTREPLMGSALLRNPAWQDFSVLELDGRDLLNAIETDVSVIVNPWTALEYRLPTAGEWRSQLLLQGDNLA